MSEDPTLLSWAKTYDFSLEELALIQPGYFGLDSFTMNFIVMKFVFIVFAAYLAGFSTFLLASYETEPVMKLLILLVCLSGITILSQILLLVYIYGAVEKTNNPLLLSAGVDFILGGCVLYTLTKLHDATFEDTSSLDPHLYDDLSVCVIIAWVAFGVWCFGWCCCNCCCAVMFRFRRYEDAIRALDSDYENEDDDDKMKGDPAVFKDAESH